MQLVKTRRITLSTDRWPVAVTLPLSKSPQVACYPLSVKSRITAIRIFSLLLKVKLLPTEARERKLKRLSASKIHQSESKLSIILDHPPPEPIIRKTARSYRHILAWGGRPDRSAK